MRACIGCGIIVIVNTTVSLLGNLPPENFISIFVGNVILDFIKTQQNN